MKEQIAQLKLDIKEMSAHQRYYKNQRKTVHIAGDREIDVQVAAYMHASARVTLRHMFIVYGEVRNKPVGFEPISEVLLSRVRNKYFPDGYVEKVDENAQNELSAV